MRPGAIVEIKVEAGQHDRALRSARDRRDEAGGGAIGAGRAGNDGRTSARSALERLDFVVDQERDPGRPVDESALGEPQWPMGEGDLEEVEGDAPIGIVSVGRERLDLGPWRALDDHVVDQRRKVAGERVGLRRRRRDQRGLGGIDDEPPVAVDRADRAAQSLAPGARHGCEHMAAGQVSDGARQGGARRSFVAFGGEGGRRLVRLEGAERRDTRQDKAALAARHEQRLGQGFGGALRRHVDCGVGQRHCSAGAGEAVDEGAVEKSVAQSRQERRAGGNREDSGLANGHGRLLGGRRPKASRVVP